MELRFGSLIPPMTVLLRGTMGVPRGQNRAKIPFTNGCASEEGAKPESNSTKPRFLSNMVNWVSSIQSPAPGAL
eukprot:3623593-Pyramimonas_sp.AAC.1